MQVTFGPDGKVYVAAASPANHLLVFYAVSVDGTWQVMDVTAKIQGEVPQDPPFLVLP